MRHAVSIAVLLINHQRISRWLQRTPRPTLVTDRPTLNTHNRKRGVALLAGWRARRHRAPCTHHGTDTAACAAAWAAAVGRRHMRLMRMRRARTKPLDAGLPSVSTSLPLPKQLGPGAPPIASEAVHQAHLWCPSLSGTAPWALQRSQSARTPGGDTRTYPPMGRQGCGRARELGMACCSAGPRPPCSLLALQVLSAACSRITDKCVWCLASAQQVPALQASLRCTHMCERSHGHPFTWACPHCPPPAR